MRKTADVVIIGGGIIGCATGYYLAKAGQKVILVEKEYLTAGSTGRCIGGIRQQFSTETAIKVAMGSVKLFNEMEEELGMSVEWYPGGYLLLSHSEEQKKGYLKTIELQKRLGLPVDFISPEEVLEIVPGLNSESLVGAAHCPTDGQANPFLVVNGYADGIKRFGGEILTYTEVTGIKTNSDKVASVKTKTGDEIFAPCIVNAAGPWAKEVGKIVGLELPIEPERHEALVTEGPERMFEPMLVDYRLDGCYFLQKVISNHFIGCYTPENPVKGTSKGSSLEFIREMSSRMIRLVPKLEDLKILRQWGGSYCMTPDGNPILDKTEIDGLYVAGGMSGHGFMLGPMLGKLMAEFMTTGEASIPLDEFSLKREFAKKEALK
jgi:sarcosine oxidase subunit beta